MRLFADPARLQKLSALAVNLTDESGDMSQNIRLFSNVIESAAEEDRKPQLQDQKERSRIRRRAQRAEKNDIRTAR